LSFFPDENTFSCPHWKKGLQAIFEMSLKVICLAEEQHLHSPGSGSHHLTHHISFIKFQVKATDTYMGNNFDWLGENISPEGSKKLRKTYKARICLHRHSQFNFLNHISV
jgi:hypothetical protein